jgi:uncharacterized RDD family membrane protein YckC/energy-coupling factor transporter ATP-binding protein EcfA2
VSAPAAKLTRNPFPGLRPFWEDEDHLFFGRENQVDRMVDKLAAERFLAVVGTSGAGKSSLVNCGLRPALRRGLMTGAGTVWRMVQFRPGGNPLRAMAQAIAANESLFAGFRPEGLPLDQIVEATLRMSNLGLSDVFEQSQSGAHANLLVVVDQFEELFRYHKPEGNSEAQERAEEAAAFVKLLLEGRAQTASPVYVVLTMRSDFLGDCSRFDGLPEAINQSQYLVPRLTREERRAAIAGPVGVAGGQISPVLLTRLVNDVGENPDQLSILQHALHRTWDAWERDTNGAVSLMLSHYEAIGTMTHALDRHAEQAWEELQTERERNICEKIFRALTDKSTDIRGVRRPTRFSDLCAIADAAPNELGRVIEVFRQPDRSFLMPPHPEPLRSGTVIDISHESLMRIWQRLKDWADEERESAKMYRRLSETAALYETGKAGLWRNPDLPLALEWERKNQPTAAWAEFYKGSFESAKAFLDKSKAARSAQVAEKEFMRRWRKLRNTIAVLSVLLFTFLLDPVSKFIVLWNVGGLVPETLMTSFAVEVCALLCLAAYAGVAFTSKRGYRQLAFERLATDIAASGTAAHSASPVFAGLFRRGTAYAIDFVPFLIVLLPLIVWAFLQTVDLGGGAWGARSVSRPAWFLLVAEGGSPRPRSDFEKVVLPFLTILAIFPLDWLYQATMTSSRQRATLGKMAVGIVVTDMEGNRLSFRRATIRYLARTLSYVSLGSGFLMQPFTSRKQTLHDLIAKTLVMRRTPEPDDVN